MSCSACLDVSTHKIHVIWNILDACVYSCPECQFAQAGATSDYGREKAFGAASRLMALPFREISVDICGGEPTLHPYLSQIIKFLLRPGSNVGKVELHTNGWRDPSWYARLARDLPKDKFSMRLWPKPDFGNLRELLILCGLIRDLQYGLSVSLSQPDSPRYPLFAKAFLELSTELYMEIELPANEDKTEDIVFCEDEQASIRKKKSGVKGMYCCPSFHALRLDYSGFHATCPGLTQSGQTPGASLDAADLADLVLSCGGCAVECSAPRFNTREDAEFFLSSYERANLRQRWELAPFFNPADPRIDPGQALLNRVRRICETDPPEEYLEHFFANMDKLVHILESLADCESQANFARWLAKTAQGGENAPLDIQDLAAPGHIALVRISGADPVLYTDLQSRQQDVNGSAPRDAQSAALLLASLYGRCRRLYLDYSYPEIFPAIRAAILWHMPEVLLALPGYLEQHKLPDCSAFPPDYSWRVEEDCHVRGKFWLVGSPAKAAEIVADQPVSLTMVFLEDSSPALTNLATAYPSLDILVLTRGKSVPLLPPNARAISMENGSLALAMNLAIEHARNEYISFIDDSIQITDQYLENFRAIQARPDVIICDLGKEHDIGPTVQNSVFAASRKHLIYNLGYLRKLGLRHRNVEPVISLLFNLEAILRTANIQHLPAVKFGNSGAAGKLAPGRSYLDNLGELAFCLDVLCRGNPELAAGNGREYLAAQLMEIFWPLVQKEIAAGLKNGNLFEIVKEDALQSMGAFPEITQWILDELAEKEYARMSGVISYSPEENEKYVLEMDMVDNPDLRPDQEWDEYISRFAGAHPESPVLSVIMPNFNKGKYLGDALASVLSQNFGDFEILLVDDVSTDGGYEICQDYADADSRIRLWRMRHNSRQGICRNKAISQARGKYLICVDSDDLVHPNFLAKAVADMERHGAEMIVYGMQEIDEQGNVAREVRPESGIIEGSEIFNAFWDDRLPWGPWAKIYDAGFIKRNAVRFAEYIYHQDVFFLNDFALAAKKIAVMAEIAYSCRLTADSSVRPARHSYAHLHSAIAKLGLRNAMHEEKHIRLGWQRVAKDAIYTLQMRILPCIARAYGMFGAVPLARADLEALSKNSVGMFVLFTRHIYDGMHNRINPLSLAKAGKISPPLDARSLLERFALVDEEMLKAAQSLPDPAANLEAQIRFVKASGLFNNGFYLAAHEDIRKSGLDPVRHYCERWRLETWRDPAPWFSTRNYLDAYADVAAFGVNPFIHYIRNGHAEGRNPRPPQDTTDGMPLYNRDFDSILNLRPAPGTILLVEANNCHCDIPPGIAGYLVDLGYKVNVVIMPSQAALDPFCRWNKTRMRCWALPFHEIAWLLQNGPYTHEYEYVFFNSYTLYKRLGEIERPSVLEHFPNLIQTKRGILAVMHHYELWDREKIARERIMTLTDVGGSDLVVNPHRFGAVRVTGKQAGKAHFIVVGALEADRRNVPLLFESAEKLLDKGIESFYVSIIGRGIVKRPQRLAKYSELMGEATYKEMFKKMEDAAFFLPLLDPENPEHERYLKTAISGAFMLCYCFRKPMIVARKFAAKYGLNESNAIIYERNDDLVGAMKRAIDMEYPEYKKMQENLARLADSLAERSLANLKRILGQN